MQLHQFLPLFVLIVLAASATIEPRPEADDAEVVSAEPETNESTVTPIRVPPRGDQKKDTNKNDKLPQRQEPFYPGQTKLMPPSLGGKVDFDVDKVAALCYNNHFIIHLELSSPFNGYIYPYHKFKTCSLLAGNGNPKISFRLEKDSCGMDITQSNDDGIISFMEYTFMIQWNKEVIGKYDRKLQITCNRETSDHRVVELADDDDDASPQILMNVETQSEDESDDGDGDVYDMAHVGEQVEVTFRLASPSSTKYDLRVVNCSAQDGLHSETVSLDTYNDGKTGHTSNYNGRKNLYRKACPVVMPGVVPYLAEFTKETTKGGVVVATSSFRVFRFPSSPFIILQCDVQVCKGECSDSERVCTSKLDSVSTEPDFHQPNSVIVKLFRPIMVKVGGMPMDHHGFHDEEPPMLSKGVPTASFIAGLIGMGFICAIVCVFMYRRFKKGSENQYKMEYHKNNDKTKEEVEPLKVPTSASVE